MQICTRETAAWRLFHLRYEVMASPLIRVSTHMLEKGNYHFNVTGDREVDKLANGRMDKTYLNAAAITMLMAEGHTIGLIKVHDCVQIFHDVQEHLQDWRNQCAGATHAGMFPPIEDLRAFESLALEVYEHAQKLEPRTEVRSALFDNLLNMNRRRNLTSTNKWLRDRTQEGEVIRPYISIVDEIERHVAELM